MPTKSELKHVLKRRRSRQSTRMPTQVDFEYVGNTAGLLNQHVQTHNKHQLDFELNLRQYRRESDFLADQPWLYPAPRSFKPSESLREYAVKAKGTNYDTRKNKFLDVFDEHNMNEVSHLAGKNVQVFRNAQWMASLRGDRAERNKIEAKKRSSKSPLLRQQY